MKAIRKYDGKEVDVTIFHPKEYIATELDDVGGYAVYREDDLILEDPVDWSAFRREAAKDILPSLIEKASEIYTLESLVKEVWCEQAVEWADELIKQLRDENNRTE